MPEKAVQNATLHPDHRRPIVGVTAAFMAHALLFASWTAHIPHIKQELGLSNADLGTALLGAPVGSVCAMLISRWLLPKWGSHVLVRITLIGYASSGVSVGLATSQVWLLLALAFWGLFQGSLDVAMNTQAVTVENTIRRPIMARFHGMWSIGGFIGALLGAGAVSLGVPLSPQLAVLGVIVLVVVGYLTTGLVPDNDPAPGHRAQQATEPEEPRRSRVGIVLLLGGVSMASMMLEGAAADWSANYLGNVLNAPAGVAGLAYAGYTLTMVVTRLTGSFLQARVPSRRLLPLLALVPAVSMTAALLSDSIVGTLIAFATMGFGLALVVPTAFTAASAAMAGASNAGSAVATVAAMGWLGYVTGPPLIGHLAELIGLRAALAVIPTLAVVIATTIFFSRTFAKVRDGVAEQQ